MASGNYRLFGPKQKRNSHRSSINGLVRPLKESSPARNVFSETNLPPPYQIADNINGLGSLVCDCGKQSPCELCSIRVHMAKTLHSALPFVDRIIRMNFLNVDAQQDNALVAFNNNLKKYFKS
uniref:C2 DOCK-type domain-containing protein n=1 Tax=Mesocestoides corti TaxID=53468 RepID=A0A5K3EJ33_MESCO